MSGTATQRADARHDDKGTQKKPHHKKRKPLANNGERRNFFDVISVDSDDTRAHLSDASVISLQNLDDGSETRVRACVARHIRRFPVRNP
ncbi:hypothetical protein [Paraburkholderia flava]|uniref:hypothetical protein n=1 Tax=Paraburkholderia flava TaxID=2547393 RepID=UPI00105B806C|nr:hypothetical protein [Paraburkholderia flava]